MERIEFLVIAQAFGADANLSLVGSAEVIGVNDADGNLVDAYAASDDAEPVPYPFAVPASGRSVFYVDTASKFWDVSVQSGAQVRVYRVRGFNPTAYTLEMLNSITGKTDEELQPFVDRLAILLASTPVIDDYDSIQPAPAA